MKHSTYHDDPDIQSAIEACVNDMTSPEQPDGTLTRAFVIKRIPIRVTTNNGVLCAVEHWEPIGGGLAHHAQDYTCFVCREPIDEEPHTFHAEGCPKREERPCEDYPCLNLSGCGEDCHELCCPTCSEAVDPDAPVLGYEAVDA